ncbi:MAG TPA: hypothetical protein PLF59_20665 [Cyclobacteriaceae bacterium]|nr:hypothetical protein [Cyclobacteriaceae bacterium]
MTGQGNTRHEQIKAAHQEQRQQLLSSVSLDKEYRTASGYQVRGLQFNYRKKKSFIFGDLKSTGNGEHCVQGQVKINNEWIMHWWNLQGEHDYYETFNLVEYKPEAPKHPELF